MTAGAPIDVVLRATWIVGVGYRYDVILDGKTIVRRSRDPEHEAARALLSRGLRGEFRTLDFTTGRPRMVLDIEKAARLRVVERDTGGPPVLCLYRAMSDNDRMRARGLIHRADRGKRSGPGVLLPASASEKPAGDVSGAVRRQA